MILHKNQIIPVTITSLSSDGNGIGRYNGQVIFVANTAPQDELSIKIIKVTTTYCIGRIEEILVPSAVRIASKCPVSIQCGGCCFRHISYTAELEAKQQFVKDALQRIGDIHNPLLPILASPCEDRYRNKVQYAFQNLQIQTGKMQLVHGFYAPHTHHVIATQDCLLQPEIINKIACRCTELFEQFDILAYEKEFENKEVIRSLYIRESTAENTFMVCFVCGKKPLSAALQIATILAEEFSEISTILLNCNASTGNTLLGKKTTTLIGTGNIDENICNVPVTISLHSFFQVNYLAAQHMFNTIKELVQPTKEDILIDLYCGCGVIGLSMAKEVKELIGVEIVEQAVMAAEISSAKLGLENTSFYCDDAQAAAEKLALNKIQPSIIIVDPPRKGCSDKTLQAIIEMSPQKIVMVSCNPSTLARDLKMLLQHDYIIQCIQPLDMFPRTKHVEVIVLLIKK